MTVTPGGISVALGDEGSTPSCSAGVNGIGAVPAAAVSTEEEDLRGRRGHLEQAQRQNG